MQIRESGGGIASSHWGMYSRLPTLRVLALRLRDVQFWLPICCISRTRFILLYRNGGNCEFVDRDSQLRFLVSVTIRRNAGQCGADRERARGVASSLWS